MREKILAIIIVLFVSTIFTTRSFSMDEPALPMGLAKEPAFPSGLDSLEDKSPEEPLLPEGLIPADSSGKQKANARVQSPKLPFDLTGFWEVRGGLRTQPDPNEKDASLGETRLQTEIEKRWPGLGFKLVTDFLYDPVFNEHPIRLEENQGWLLLREAVVSWTPISFLDIKAGRQILTWGTGDMLFINDLFPKDWKSFFTGRDPEYLKAPSDAVKVSMFSDIANLDVIYTPRFDSDRFIEGKRLSYWSNTLGRQAGRDAIVTHDKPEKWFEDDELSTRLFKNISGYELAVYTYQGFWKSPGGQDATGRATFPKLAVYGGSARGVVGNGIGNVEFGYYDSKEDRDGNNPLINNSQIRTLVGYEQEIAKDFTVALQHYLEYMLDYNDYQRTLPPGSPMADKDRHVLTLRLTQLLMNQNLELSLFTYYSPSDKDVYMQPKAHYKIDDYWSAEIGGNIFLGAQDQTFFGQFEENSNLYMGIRYSF